MAKKKLEISISEKELEAIKHALPFHIQYVKLMRDQSDTPLKFEDKRITAELLLQYLNTLKQETENEKMVFD